MADDTATDSIQALGDEDYKDPDDHYKMVELLKGLAASAQDGDDKAKDFLDQVSDELTDAANTVLDESDKYGVDGLEESANEGVQNHINSFLGK